MKKLLTLLAAAMFVAVSCKPDNVDNPGDKEPTKLETPANLAFNPANITKSSVVLTWDEVDSDEVKNYTVSYVPQGETAATEVDVTDNSCPVTGLESDKTYIFKVKANSTKGSAYDSDWSATKSVTTAKDSNPEEPAKLETPANLAFDPEDITESSVVLTWDVVESDEVESYTVSYVEEDETAATEVDVTDNRCPVTGLEPEKTYIFKVKANSTEGEEYDSDWSETKSVTTLEPSLVPLGIPENLHQIADKSSSTQIGLAWNEVERAVKYIISYKSAADSDYETVDRETAGIVVEELSPDTQYSFKVQAVSSTETSDFSEEINIATYTRSMGIYTAGDFVAFAAGDADGGEWKSGSGDVVIQRDIDMTDVEWTPMPEFTGTLDGNGKSISNLSYSSSDAEHVALIAVLNGTVKNLTLDASCTFESNRTAVPSVAALTTKTASLAALMKGGLIENCVNKASVKAGLGSDFIGGLVALAKPETTATITGCINEGTVAFAGAAPWVSGKQLYIGIGGIAGSVETGTVFSSCINKGIVSSANTAPGGSIPLHIGGISGMARDVTISSCTNDALATIRITNNPHRAYVGGINGYGYSVSFDRCVNRGGFDITDQAKEVNTEFMLGGIEGYFAAGALTDKVMITGCYNYSDITLVNNVEANKPVTAAGIIGNVNSGTVPFEIDNCHNEGDLNITAAISTSQMGGIVAIITGSATNLIKSCSNKGEINSYMTLNRAFHVGGIVGVNKSATTTIRECNNSGDLNINNTSKTYGGGIIGEATGNSIIDCVNTGDIYALLNAGDVAHLGGIASRTYNGGMFTGCRNEGNIIYGGTNSTIGNDRSGGFGGIAGYVDKNVTIDDCTNVGTIIGDAAGLGKKGSICGWAAADGAATIKNCTVRGAVGNYNAEATDYGVSAATALTAANFNSYVYGAKINALTESGNSF